MAGKTDGPGIQPLHFFGERDRPDRAEKVLDRPFVRGDGKIPDGLRELKSRLSVYSHSTGKKDRPKIETERVESRDGRSTWRVDLPIGDKDHRLGLALPGREAIREKPEVFLKQTSAGTPFASFRPSWIDATFAPRIVTHDRFRPMRRINGRPVNPLYVFGPDDRWAFRDPSWPWGLVGKVFTSSGWTGSAALIGDRIIATAGHVVPWDDNPWWMRFVPAFYDGSSLHGVGVESYVSDARGYDVNGNVTGYDWAVCRLYQPLGSWLGYFGYNGYSSSWEDDPYWSLIGYPGAIAGGQRPSFQGSVSSFDTDGDSNGGLEIETRGDLTPGNSGGPMFGWWSGDPRLIGVVSGEEEDWSPGFWPWEWADTERGNVIAGGSGFTNLMAWGRSNWPL
ncbi:MAG: serine protease [Thermoanaerobaculales bacterium]|nr:serine protease [Thermoanaerobaculales bacterium]